MAINKSQSRSNDTIRTTLLYVGVSILVLTSLLLVISIAFKSDHTAPTSTLSTADIVPNLADLPLPPVPRPMTADSYTGIVATVDPSGSLALKTGYGIVSVTTASTTLYYIQNVPSADEWLNLTEQEKISRLALQPTQTKPVIDDMVTAISPFAIGDEQAYTASRIIIIKKETTP